MQFSGRTHRMRGGSSRTMSPRSEALRSSTFCGRRQNISYPAMGWKSSNTEGDQQKQANLKLAPQVLEGNGSATMVAIIGVFGNAPAMGVTIVFEVETTTSAAGAAKANDAQRKRAKIQSVRRYILRVSVGGGEAGTDCQTRRLYTVHELVPVCHFG